MEGQPYLNEGVNHINFHSVCQNTEVTPDLAVVGIVIITFLASHGCKQDIWMQIMVLVLLIKRNIKFKKVDKY